MTGPEITSKRMKQLDELLARLGIAIGRMALIEEALTHSSFASENPGATHNERLEFFGDAVLKFVVSEYLLERFPDYDEGQLTEIRAVLVSSNALAEVAEQFNLAKYILVGRGVQMRKSIVARSMEAILGAVYLDSGLPLVQNLIVRLLGARATAVDRDEVKDNFKAQLQEWTQSRASGIPVYAVQSVEGPAHDPRFTVTVAIAGTVVGTGSGQSKKSAEQAAARAALERVEAETDPPAD